MALRVPWTLRFSVLKIAKLRNRFTLFYYTTATGGLRAGGGCDYTAGSNDYLNPYQEYVYNYMVYPAGCGYYNGMPVPNYPAYGGGGYTPPSQASNQYQRPNNGAAQPTHELVDVLNEQ
jgi:hypothetical protein